MPEFTDEIPVAAARADVWGYVKDVDNWATLFPGHQRHLLVEEDHYFWQLRGEAGIWSRMVDLDVYVTDWKEPDDVAFRFTSRTEPVEGTGRFYARPADGTGSVMGFALDVRASGTAAPMINALLKRTVPELSGPFLVALGRQLAGLPAAGTDGDGDGQGPGDAAVGQPPVGGVPRADHRGAGGARSGAAVPPRTAGWVVVEYGAPRTEAFERWWQETRLAGLLRDPVVLGVDRYELIGSGATAGYRELLETADVASTLAGTRTLLGGAEHEGMVLTVAPYAVRRVDHRSRSRARRLLGRLRRRR